MVANNKAEARSRASDEGCCETIGARAREILDQVPPCTGKMRSFRGRALERAKFTTRPQNKFPRSAACMHACSLFLFPGLIRIEYSPIFHSTWLR
jgi:hypothetical protein